MVLSEDVLRFGDHHGHSDVDILLSRIHRHHLRVQRTTNGVVALPDVLRHQFAGLHCRPECRSDYRRLVRCCGM